MEPTYYFLMPRDLLCHVLLNDLVLICLTPTQWAARGGEEGQVFVCYILPESSVAPYRKNWPPDVFYVDFSAFKFYNYKQRMFIIEKMRTKWKH